MFITLMKYVSHNYIDKIYVKIPEIKNDKSDIINRHMYRQMFTVVLPN